MCAVTFLESPDWLTLAISGRTLSMKKYVGWFVSCLNVGARRIIYCKCIVLLTRFRLQCSHCGATLGVGAGPGARARGRGSGRRSAQSIKDGAQIYFYSMNSEKVRFHVRHAPSIARNNVVASVAFCQDFVLFRKVMPHFGPLTHAIHGRLARLCKHFRWTLLCWCSAASSGRWTGYRN